MLRTYVFLAALLLAILLGYSFLPHLNQPLTKEQAEAFLAQDLSASGAEWQVLESKQDGGSWQFTVLVAQNAHSTCPQVEKRYYTLPPVSYRPDPLISDCSVPRESKLLFREEALINSALYLKIKDGYGCAFKSDANFLEEQPYCPKENLNLLSACAQNLPAESWVAFWDLGGSQKVVALDQNGNHIDSAGCS